MTTKGDQSQRVTKFLLPAENARVKAGFTLKEAAKRMRISEKYLRQLERSGRAPLKTARRLSRLYKCSAEIFIHTPHYLEQLEKRTIQVPNASPLAGANKGSNSFASRRSSSSKIVPLKLVKGIKGDIAPSSTAEATERPRLTVLPAKNALLVDSPASKSRSGNAATHWSRRQHEEDSALIQGNANKDML